MQLSKLEKHRTARAWGITNKQFSKLYMWVAENVPDQWKSKVLGDLLRKEYKKNH